MRKAATPLIHRFPSPRPKRRFRLLTFLAVFLLLLAGSSLTGLFDCLPGLRSYSASPCTIPPASSVDSDAREACQIPEPGACAVDPDTVGRPVEISDWTSDGDTLLSLMSLNLCDDKVARKVAESLASAMQPTLGQKFRSCDQLDPGKRYLISLDERGEFRRATVELGPSHVFHCTRDGGVVRSWKEDVVLDYKVEVLSFPVQKDIVQSVLAAHESRELALKLVHVFRWDIDFQADSKKGDLCRVVFERRYADDKPAGYGRILFATYDGKRTGRKTACLFNGEYYDKHGVELRKNYLRTPLNTLRITSGYGMRVHPVLQEWKMHNGVDYGAPVGTPVYAISNGTITFQGWEDAYGLYVCVRHENGYESRYSHLSRILVKTGQRVKQRQTIGLVGSTGRSTGPHLFFEIIANGKRIDPTKVKMIKNPRSVASPLQNRFRAVVGNHEQCLDKDSVRRTEQAVPPKSPA